jgi:hypothetical protein
MKKTLLALLFVFQMHFFFGQTSSTSCITATPICDGTVNTFPSSINTTAQAGPNYGCLGSQPNPAWFYFKIDSAGSIIIDISQMSTTGAGVDVDFICWGPFSSPTAPCTGALASTTAVDCSYSTAFMETVDVYSAAVGSYYIMMITNFSNMPANITFSVNPASTGAISCTEACVTNAYYNSPLCINGTLQLLSTNHLGVGTYSWSGPNGFTSNMQDPSIIGVDGTAEGNYYVNYLRDSTCNVTDTIYVNVDTCGSLTGNVFADINQNCAYDSSENYIPGVQIKLSQGGTFVSWAWTDPFGYYYFDVPIGTYTIEILPSSHYPISCPGSMAHSTIVSSTAITVENFAIDCNALDAAATTLTVFGTAFFPGQTSSLFPGIASNGPHCNTDTVPGLVTVILDPLVHYAGPYFTYPAPDSVSPATTGDTLRWNVANVNEWMYGYLNYPFNYTTDVTATIGDTVHITLSVMPYSTDSDSTNNVKVRDFVVGNSYDPNSKEVEPAGFGADGFIPASTSKLEYVVNFQNTGTAPAHNIYILDTLDSNVDITTLEIISSSHPQSTTLLAGNVLKFSFSNIMLPDTFSNEPQSHGFVKYAIAPNAGLAPGDKIRNTAYIYFDYNPPIVTNTALNTIEYLTGIEEQTEYNSLVFPNPSGNSVNVLYEDKTSLRFNLKIISVSGQVIFEENNNNFNGRFAKALDLSAYSKGVYLVRISTDKHVIHKKLIKN